jgi:hypothetical protein
MPLPVNNPALTCRVLEGGRGWVGGWGGGGETRGRGVLAAYSTRSRVSCMLNHSCMLHHVKTPLLLLLLLGCASTLLYACFSWLCMHQVRCSAIRACMSAAAADASAIQSPTLSDSSCPPPLLPPPSPTHTTPPPKNTYAHTWKGLSEGPLATETAQVASCRCLRSAAHSLSNTHCCSAPLTPLRAYPPPSLTKHVRAHTWMDLSGGRLVIGTAQVASCRCLRSAAPLHPSCEIASCQALLVYLHHTPAGPATGRANISTLPL